MILLDAYALIAFLAGEPAAEHVEPLFGAGAGITTPNLIETIYILNRDHDLSPPETRKLVSAFPPANLTIVPLSERAAWRAGELRIAHYHRTRCPVSLADRTLIAAAEPGDAVATADPHVLAVAEAEKIETVALPGRA